MKGVSNWYNLFPPIKIYS